MVGDTFTVTVFERLFVRLLRAVGLAQVSDRFGEDSFPSGTKSLHYAQLLFQKVGVLVPGSFLSRCGVGRRTLQVVYGGN